MRRSRVILAAAVLGLANNLAVVWALAAWMPLEMYPRQVIRYFVAGGRPWGTAERGAGGVHNIWWDEIDSDSYTPWRQPGDPADRGWPVSSEDWVRFARNQHGASGDVRGPTERPPPWGTFGGGDAPPALTGAGSDFAFGWPLPTLWFQVVGTIAGNTASAEAIRGGVLLTSPGSLDIRGYSFRALPLRPVWNGVLLNSLLYAALWWFLLAGPPALRRRLRTRADRCAQCGYSLRGLEPDSRCPECGGETGSSR